MAKDVKDTGSSAMYYGNQVHKAAEDYIKDGVPIPTKFKFLQRPLDVLNKIDGDKHCEIRMGVTKQDNEYTPTGFFGKDVWWRGIADLLIVNGKKAYLIDYKTGKNAAYADTKQLDLLAGATFTHFPEVETVKSALLYVVSNDFIRKKHTADLRKSYLSVFDEELDRLEVALEEDVWNAVESGLCGFCPVTSCEHNRK